MPLVSTLLSFALLLLGLAASAQDHTPDEDAVTENLGGTPFSPYVGRDFPTQVFWGETHLHTAISVDAGTMCTLGQEAAFRFARGEEVVSTHGLPVKLGRPLDFIVVSDHAEMYGLMPRLKAGDPTILATETGRRWYEQLQGDPDQVFATAMEIVGSLQKPDPPFRADKLVRDAWHTYTALADRYNDPGRFTALIGYEWTSMGGFNLHRNVVFRGDASVANQTVPFSQFDSQNPEDLWRALAAFEERTGSDVLAIPHNGNLSNGRMFTVETFAGKGLTRELAALRARMEPIIEATQIKGDSETHPYLSPNDEFADYETWDRANLDGTELKTKDMLRWEYSREALKTGLLLERKLGVNPYKFGMIGSSDSHTALTTVEEDNFFGKHSGVEPEPHRWEHVVIASPKDPGLNVLGWQQAASGRAAVWATENTREAIFDAMERKEVYATTGTRILVRFFGGWDFEPDDALLRLPANAGYARGVPMGGDLLPGPDGGAPSFLAAARKDPMSGSLDRIQIIKGWLDAKGELHEKVYDVAWSDDRMPGADGKLPPVGDTVDVANATWTNTIGASELIAVWEDPDFDPTERAFYYARVIEIPTPRWTAYEARRFGLTLPPEVPMKTQERAYTSPIWYTP